MESRSSEVLRFFEAHKEYMEDRIASGIEAHRKGFLKLQFVDGDGNPLPHVQVKLEQKTHDFRFGCNLFMLDELETEEKNRTYQQLYPTLFNLATLPFYWDAIEPEADKPRYDLDSPKLYRRPNPELCLQYCEKHNIEPKLHCLVYDHWTPEWVPRQVQEVKRLLEKRIGEIAQRFADRIPSMEVTNETLHREGKRVTPFFYAPDLISWSYDRAKAHLPANRLIINEATQYVWGRWYKYTRSSYYLQIQQALEEGAQIDSIGMQFHMFWPRQNEPEECRYTCDPVRLYEIMDTYADFGKPLQVTEVTVPAYSMDEADEDVQAKILYHLYRIWFSHPNMEAIIYWNMVDGYAAFAQPGDMTSGENAYHGGLLRFDMSPKPAWKTLDKLINHDWHTSLALDTGDANTLTAKGFYGEYQLTATVGDKTVSRRVHLKKGDNATLTITI